MALAICCALAVFIGIMLTDQLLSHARQGNERLEDLAQDLEKRISAVTYFFSERYADLENLGVSRELVGYFENQALGMSMKYGLRSSLYNAVRRFNLLRETKTIGGDPIYRRLVFILKSGDILIDTSGAEAPFPGFCSHWLAPGKKAGEILGKGSQIAISMPFEFKHAYAGLLVSFLDSGAIYRNLVRHSGDTPRFFAMTTGKEPIRIPKKAVTGVNGEMEIRPDRISEKGFQPIPIKGDPQGLLAMKTRVPATPFFIVCLSRSRSISPSALYATMAAFVLFLATAIFFIWRTATQRLIFGIRLDESRKNETRFRDLVDNLPVPIWESDFDLVLTYANQEALNFFGYSKKDIGTPLDLTQLVPQAYRELVKQRFKSHALGQNPGPVDMELLRKDGQEVWGKVIPILILKKDRPVGVRFCFQDLTQQRRLEQETIKVIEQEKFALVGQVAGKMAHDFNNILSAIMGNAELSLLDCRDREISRTLEIILEQAKRGNILTRNLVAFSKDQEIREEYFNINEKMDLVLDLLKKELERVTVIKKYQDHPPDLLADPGMIEHSLVNLVQNAVHAMSKTPHPVLGLETKSDGSRMTIVVQDNGCGIPKAYCDKVYSPSFSLKGSRDFTKVYPPDVKGTGYGLSNVKKYIDKHKGRIEFISQEGNGTRFSITLPLKARTLFPREKEALMKKPVRQNRHILVVEDEAAISMVLCKILSSDPFYHKVTLAENGEEAVARIKEEGERFDLVSLDYILPGEMNGLGVYTHLRKRYPKLPVVFISGNLRFLKSIEAMKTSDPHVDHLSKPFENRVYADKINQWLQARH